LPHGLLALKIQYFSSVPTITCEHYIFAQKELRADIEKIFAAKLSNLDLSDILRIPKSNYDKFLYYHLEMQVRESTISQTGIFHGNSAILWQSIADCQWRELKDCDSLMSRFLQLNKHKNYCILRVKRVEKQRSQWIEIPVPGSLVAQAHELLVKYLPDHVQINQPPIF
jgi:hypothetical protein